MHTLAAPALTTPAMLFGAALVVLPIAAHLLNRKARQRVVFPSVALLSSVSASQSSFFKLRRWVLLLLRCTAVFLAVLAFARPVWIGGSGDTARTAGGSESGGGAAVVIVLDVSASTQQVTSGGQTAAAQLRSHAVRELGQLRAGADAANVVLADATPSPVFETMTRNLAALRQAVENVEPTDHRADLAGAITLAGELLRSHDGPASSKQLLVLTDGQRSNWDTLDDVELPAGVELIVQTLGDTPDKNQSISNTALNSPEARPTMPGLRTPAELSVEVVRFADAPARVRIDLFVDGREVESQWVRLGANQRQRVGFTHRFETPGQHRVQFKLDADDALSLDNTASHVVTCAGRRPVVIVGDANPDRPGSAGYYVTRALAPRNNERDRFRVTHLAATAVRGTALRQASLVVVGDVDGLDRVAEATLLDYIQNGGACLVFAGARPARSETLLPWRLVNRFGSARITDGDWPAAELSGFELEAQDALARAAVGRAWRVASIQPDARVLLTYPSGQPALSSRPLGRGQVVAATFSPANDAGDLGKYGVFVVLIQSLAEQLTTASDAVGQSFAGRPLQITASSDIDPQGSASRIETPAGETANGVVFALDADRPVATLPVAEQSGFYTWRQGPAALGQAAANVDPRESDLRVMPGEALAAALNQHGATEATTATARRGEAAFTFGGTPLWGWMLMAALGLLCVEMGVLGGWRR